MGTTYTTHASTSIDNVVGYDTAVVKTADKLRTGDKVHFSGEGVVTTCFVEWTEADEDTHTGVRFVDDEPDSPVSSYRNETKFVVVTGRVLAR